MGRYLLSLIPNEGAASDSSLLGGQTNGSVKHFMSKSNRSSKKRASSKDMSIDYSDIAELGPSFWRNVRVNLPLPKQAVSLRVDQDVLEWFRSTGKGYQSLMNAVLRAYVEAKKR